MDKTFVLCLGPIKINIPFEIWDRIVLDYMASKRALTEDYKEVLMKFTNELQRHCSKTQQSTKNIIPKDNNMSEVLS